MKYVALSTVTIVLAWCDGVQATPTRLECPQSIPQSSVRVTPQQGGWHAFAAAPLYLNSAAPADGPPERLGILRGDQLKSTKTSWTIKYTLEGPYPEGKWLRCDYGPFGGVSLSKRLPDETKECIVSGKRGPHAGENIVEITCS